MITCSITSAACSHKSQQRSKLSYIAFAPNNAFTSDEERNSPYIYDLTPALYRLDYTMSEAGGATDFVRQYTLASGGSYCDCGYKKKGFVKAEPGAGR